MRTKKILFSALLMSVLLASFGVNVFAEHYGEGMGLIGHSAFSVPGYYPPYGRFIISSGTSVFREIPDSGLSRLIEMNGALRSETKGILFSLEVKELKNESVLLQIMAGAPIDYTGTFRIDPIERRKVDMDDDGEYDLIIVFHKNWKGKADITLLPTSEKIPAKEPVAKKEPEKKAEPIPEKQPSSAMRLWVTTLVIVIIMIIGYALIRGNKKATTETGKEEEKNEER